MSELDQPMRDLVIGNRILAHQNVVDAYGHISIRHPTEPRAFPVVAFPRAGVGGRGRHHGVHARRKVVGDDRRPPYTERFIHGAIYEARPDVHSVVHSHAEETLAFGITDVPLQPVVHVARMMGPRVPVWDIAEKFGDHTNMLVSNVEHGRDLAARIGQGPVALMRGHGFAAVGSTIMDVVRISVYLPVNARVLTTAMRFGSFKPLSSGEIAGQGEFDPRSPSGWRAWEYWARRAGVGERLGQM